MNDNFDIALENYKRYRASIKCPFSEEELNKRIKMAMQTVPASKPMESKRNRFTHWASYVGVAACVGLLMIPIASIGNRNEIPTVGYGGQSIRLLCNHQCKASDIVLSLNSYLETL